MLQQNAKHTLNFSHIMKPLSLSLCCGGSAAGLAADDRGERVPDGPRDAAPLDHSLVAAVAVRPEAPWRGLRVLVAAGRERAAVVAAGTPRGWRRQHGEHGRHRRRVRARRRPGGGGPGRGGGGGRRYDVGVVARTIATAAAVDTSCETPDDSTSRG